MTWIDGGVGAASADGVATAPAVPIAATASAAMPLPLNISALVPPRQTLARGLARRAASHAPGVQPLPGGADEDEGRPASAQDDPQRPVVAVVAGGGGLVTAGYGGAGGVPRPPAERHQAA